MEFAEDFEALSPKQRAHVLAEIIHWETINARAVYSDSENPADALLAITERVHRLSAAIRDQSEADTGRWAVELVVDCGSVATGHIQKWIREAAAHG